MHTKNYSRSYENEGQPNKPRKFLLFAFVMTPLLVSLGVWQLQRADQKQQLEQKVRSMSEEKAVVLNVKMAEADTPLLVNRQVVITGHYATHSDYLLDNKMHKGVPGYQVITPLLTADGLALMVNRGWVKASPYREQLPLINTPKKQVTLMGKINQVQQNTFSLDQNTETTSWPKRIQSVNTDELWQTFQSTMAMSKSKMNTFKTFPFTIRLKNEQQAGAFITDWPKSRMTVNRHIGYAVQWFALALVLVLLTIKALTVKPASVSQEEQ